MLLKTVSITEEQESFISERCINLSKFIRKALDEEKVKLGKT